MYVEKKKASKQARNSERRKMREREEEEINFKTVYNKKKPGYFE
jgi:hypothetical protein